MGTEWSRLLRAVLIVLACVLAHRRVAASDALRVLIRVASPADHALVARVRGQLSDVNAELTPVDTAPLEATFAEQVQAAHALAEQRGADVVLWFASTVSPQPSHAAGLLVHVATPGNERILTRRLFDDAAANGGKMPSGLLEAAALAVRSAVTALASGGGIGVTTAEALAAEAAAAETATPVATAPAEAGAQSAPSNARAPATQPPSAAPASASAVGARAPSTQPPSAATQPGASTSAASARAPAAQPPSAAPASASAVGARESPELPAARSEPPEQPAAILAPSPPSAAEPIDTGSAAGVPSETGAAPVSARLQLGVQCVVDGQSDFGQRGLYARAGVGWGAFALDAYAVASLASTIDDDYFALRVARHALGGALSAHTPLTRDAQLAFGVHSGAVLLSRTSSAKANTVTPSPSSLMAAFAFGPELGFDWLFGRYGLAVQLALDVLPNAPRFESSGPSPLGAADAHRLWMLEPRLGIGLEAAVP